ncbi:LysR family transcriptional regulator [Labrys neptuniae]|uniref:LysR family transcriptional regulator n=1 Tax=Labrys neptuniae TaxID=376174 RepID=A0ABV3PHE2_9HYPH
MDKLAGMAMFVRVVEEGSFAAAAETSRVSATMVAKHVRQIEQRLGARLLHRTTRRHQLTEVGRLYYERCKTALAEVALAEASASELQANPRGRLRMVAPVSFGSESLVPALVDYLQRHLDVTVDLVLDNRTVDLIGEGCELGIHIGDLTDENLVARPLKPYRRILAAAPCYLDRRGRPQHPRELGDHDCLGHAYWRTQGIWHLVGPDGETCTVNIGGRFTTNQGSALRVAALHGAGIVLQPELLLINDIEAGRLEPVLPLWSYRPTPMHLVYAPDRRPTAMLRSAIDFLLARFG